MSTKKDNKKINVERVGNSGHPITTNPTPVRDVTFQDRIPYTTFSNGTVVQSTVDKNGVNKQILRKSNLNPAYRLEVKYNGVSTPDTLGLYRANHPNDFWAYDKLKPGTKEYEEAVEKFDLYGIPLATYGEAYDNLEEVERQVDGLQEGGEIPSNDQQQLFIAIITDMAKTLGVEPSQEFAEAVMTAFENQDDSQGLLTLFTKTKNKFMNETGLFREGGKMIAFVEKFKCGGKSSKKKTSKKQEGGEVELTRRQAKDLSKLNKGYNSENFRTAYQNAKNALANNTDLTGRERRMAARRMVSGINDVAPTTPTLGPAPQAQLNVPAPTLAQPQQLFQPKIFEPEQPVIEESPKSLDDLTFSQAFATSRKAGEKTFMWKGKKYTTELAPAPAPAKPKVEEKEASELAPSSVPDRPGPMFYPFWNGNNGIYLEYYNNFDDTGVKHDAKKADPDRRSFLQQLWDPHPEPLPTHDRKAAASEMVDDFLIKYSPRAKARQ